MAEGFLDVFSTHYLETICQLRDGVEFLDTLQKGEEELCVRTRASRRYKLLLSAICNSEYRFPSSSGVLGVYLILFGSDSLSLLEAGQMYCPVLSEEAEFVVS